MSLIEIKETLSTRDRIVFLIAWLAVWGGLAGARFAGGRVDAWTWGLVALALSLPVVATFGLRHIDRVYRGLAWLTWPIGFVMAHVLLGVIYFGLITPLGILRRRLGHDPLAKRLERSRRSYWRETPDSPSASTYFRPF